jgi:putative membrane protein
MAYRLLIFLAKLGINALALLLAAQIFHKIWFDNQQATFIAALVLALVNTYLRPLVVLLTLPINILTLGLFTLVINGLMLELVSWIIPAFHVEGFWTAVGGALVISIVSCLLNLLLQPDRVQVRIHRA